jgi:hypothetical protein
MTFEPRLERIDIRHCTECGRDFEDGDVIVHSPPVGVAHDCCAKHADAAEALGMSGYPGCPRHA